MRRGPSVLAWTPERELPELHLAAREAQWWLLEPGDEGYDLPLHAYLGFTAEQWRDRVLRGMGGELEMSVREDAHSRA